MKAEARAARGPSRRQLHIWLGLAKRAAAHGARLLRSRGGLGRRICHARGRDIKIAADAEIDQAIVALLASDDGFPLLTEESGHVGHSASAGGYCWIVDPLDGSFNYSRRIPLCAVSVALWRGSQPLLGVVHDPMRREVFSGIVGVGAWLNGRRMTISDVRLPERGVLCTGFPVASEFSTAAVARVVRAVRAFKKVRWLGSAALSLAYVASGRADAYMESEIYVWDVAAGVALVLAAGGQVRVRAGRQPLTRVVMANNGRVRTPEG